MSSNAAVYFNGLQLHNWESAAVHSISYTRMLVLVYIALNSFRLYTLAHCTARQTPNLNSANISKCPVWSQTAKLNDRQYFRLYGISVDLLAVEAIGID